ncbi:hypothetical protein ALC60_01572 [Trachymyrmex zeteki]|uniref:Uncharacterized protein n=1 Tax=Mycetomoellerius zeteki TaxID=64791 RepID=A0A151XGQ8_9HYME|nr:hypothetical protein ALC60_01572 [Trachymyrmex zeteki]
MAREPPSRYPLEVSPVSADFYSSHTGFVYNFVPFARSSRYAIDPMMSFNPLRIGITITTYIYVGESLRSQEDPFTVRNREFRVTLRGPKRRHWISWLYTCIEWILYCKLLLACK